MHADWRETGEDRRRPIALRSRHLGGPVGLWRFDGRYGQYVVVDDERGAVLTVTAHEEFRTARLLEARHEALLA